MTPRFLPMRHDWSEPFRITREHSTDVQVADDGSEVRVQRRASPNIRVTMRGVSLTEKGGGRLLAAFRGATRPLSFYVPLWCDASDLTSAITAGASSIAISTTDRPFFAAPGFAMVFRDETHAELVEFSASSSSALTIVGTVVASYAKAGTRVIPVRAMWLSLPVRLKWLNGVISAVDLEFVDQREQVGFGIDGSDTDAVAASIQIFAHSNNNSGSNIIGQANYFLDVEAIVFDDADVPIPGAQVEWTSTTGVTVTPTINSRLAKVLVETNTSPHITATCGSASATIQV